MKKSSLCGGDIQDGLTLEEMVLKFKADQDLPARKNWNPAQSLLKGYKDLVSIEDAIENAAKANDLVGKPGDGILAGSKPKRHGHQRRIKQESINNAQDALYGIKAELTRAQSFEEIFQLIEGRCGRLEGIGSLYIYDTALRIGAFLRHLPKAVYLHAGTKMGARNLGLDVRKNPLPMKELPSELRMLKAYQVEDFLCIYKDLLKTVGNLRRQGIK